MPVLLLEYSQCIICTFPEFCYFLGHILYTWNSFEFLLLDILKEFFFFRIFFFFLQRIPLSREWDTTLVESELHTLLENSINLLLFLCSLQPLASGHRRWFSFDFRGSCITNIFMAQEVWKSYIYLGRGVQLTLFYKNVFNKRWFKNSFLLCLKTMSFIFSTDLVTVMLEKIQNLLN